MPELVTGCRYGGKNNYKTSVKDYEHIFEVHCEICKKVAIDVLAISHIASTDRFSWWKKSKWRRSPKLFFVQDDFENEKQDLV